MNIIQEKLGEAVTGYVAETALGYKLTKLRMRPGTHGIDQLRHNSIAGWGIFEAKGGTSRLGTAKYGPGNTEVQQMSGHWINHELDDTIGRNPVSDPERTSLNLARRSAVPMAAVITRFHNERKSYQITITARLHFPLTPDQSPWPAKT